MQRSLTPVEAFGGGDEASVFRLSCNGTSIVLRVSPPWCTRAEIAWTHAVVKAVRQFVPEAIAPIHGSTGTIIDWEGRCVTLFPFVPGAPLDREDSALRLEAARLLAAIHRVSTAWAGRPRPPPRADRPALRANVAALEDPALDRWWERVQSGHLVCGATHGDFYRGNVLCRDGRIIGIIDWYDSEVAPLAVELAGATFEFCRNDEHVLQVERAREFVAAYRNAGGPLPDHEIAMLLPLMRWWVRKDARTSLAYSSGAENPYARNQIRAFGVLADLRLDLR